MGIPYHFNCFKSCLPQASLTALQVSETTSKYEKRVKCLSILHDANNVR